MLNIVVPMAGEGSRFKAAGYTFPKPLVEVKTIPLIQLVVQNITPRGDHRFTFICKRSHYDRYSLRHTLNAIAPRCNVVTLSEPTAGAACTVLLASDHFNDDKELMIANNDQYIEADINAFLQDARSRKLDGSIMAFPAVHPKWSYAKVDDGGAVIQVAEKRPISNHATVGIYYYRRGSMFFEGACSMIQKDIRVNNEFYVCPVYNELIKQGLNIGLYEIKANQMHGLGTPEDFDEFKRTKAYQDLLA